MKINKINEILNGEPDYRIKQAYACIFNDLLDDWLAATSLPLSLREKLNQEFPLKIEAEVLTAKERQTQKALIKLNDDSSIETVLLKHEDGRNTVCVSSQVGCPLGCLFCATGQLGFKRNLTDWEIIMQVIFFSRKLKKTGERVSNLVFMGMGEPFLNYDNVIVAIRILNDINGLNIGARHISISTIGIPEGINKLADEKLQLNLAVSLHAPNDNLRNQIIPINQQYGLKVILSAVKEYLEKTNRQVMFEYIMLKDFNDGIRDAQDLVELLQAVPKKLYVINLILYNPGEIPVKAFKPSDKKQVSVFKQILGRNKIRVTQRYRFGQEIAAACGQLAGRK